MIKICSILLLLGTIIIPESLLCQTIFLQGAVYDISTGNPLPQVDVSLDGDLGDCITDNQGRFIIKVSSKITRLTRSSPVKLRALKDNYEPFDLILTNDDVIIIKLVRKKDPSPKTSPKYDRVIAEFNTIGIKNQEFLFTSVPWPFTTDSKGEDYKSQITPADERAQIVTLNPFNSPYPTIANNEMHIKFNVILKGTEALYLNRIVVNVTEKHNIDEKTMFYNAWLPKLEVNKLQVQLSGRKMIYDITPEDEVIEVSNQRPEFFSLKIAGDSSCFNHIFTFRITTYFIDKNGKKYEFPSDRSFHIAFMKKEMPLRVNNNHRVAELIEKYSDTVISGDSGGDDANSNGMLVSDTASLNFSEQFIRNIKSNVLSILKYNIDMVRIGPSLWKTYCLSGADTTKGVFVENMETNLVGRTFFIQRDVLNFFSTDLLKYIISKHSLGGVRPATQSEREVLDDIYFEINGQPFNVFDYGDSRLVVFFEGNKLKYVDLLNYPWKVDQLNWIAHTTYRLMKFDSLLIQKIGEPKQGQSIVDTIQLKKVYELPYTEFIENLFLAAENNVFIHIGRFVQDNPANFKAFVLQALAYDSIHPIESGSFTWELLCKGAIVFMNFEHDYSVMDLLTKFSCYRSGGGKYLLHKMQYVHNNLHGESDSRNYDALKILTDKTLYQSLTDSISKSLVFLKSEKLQEAYDNYIYNVRKLLMLKGSYEEEMVAINPKMAGVSNGLALNLFLYIVLLKLGHEDEYVYGLLCFCYSLRMPFASVFMASPFLFPDSDDNLRALRRIIQAIPENYVDNFDSANVVLNNCIDEITCKGFSRFIYKYNVFSNHIIANRFDEAMQESLPLLNDLTKYKNPVFDMENYKNEILRFRAAMMAKRKNMKMAIEELDKTTAKFDAATKKTLHDRILKMPDFYLQSNEITYRQEYTIHILSGMRNGSFLRKN